MAGVSPRRHGEEDGGLITNRRQLQPLHLPRKQTGPMGFSHVSKTDETNSDVFHKWRIMSGIRGVCQFPGWVMDYQLRIRTLNSGSQVFRSSNPS